jgi:hypothetical protein
MPCRSVPPGPHESARLFTKAMTAQDGQKADRFMREYREWERDVARWRAFWSGGAPYWVGPRPRRPGPPPATPTITNTACQAAEREGVDQIYTSLTAEVTRKFECTGSCPGGGRCAKKFSRRKGDGYSLEEKKTYCVFTVYGDCGCPGDRPPAPVEA